MCSIWKLNSKIRRHSIWPVWAQSNLKRTESSYCKMFSQHVGRKILDTKDEGKQFLLHGPPYRRLLGQSMRYYGWNFDFHHNSGCVPSWSVGIQYEGLKGSNRTLEVCMITWFLTVRNDDIVFSVIPWRLYQWFGLSLTLKVAILSKPTCPRSIFHFPHKSPYRCKQPHQ